MMKQTHSAIDETACREHAVGRIVAHPYYVEYSRNRTGPLRKSTPAAPHREPAANPQQTGQRRDRS